MTDETRSVTYLDYNVDALLACLEELQGTLWTGDDVQIECIFKSNKYPNERQVFKLTTADRIFALKLDTQAHQTHRLQTEFQNLQKLRAVFQTRPHDDVVEPVYQSNTGTFIVTGFVNAPSALDILRNTSDRAQIAQTFYKAGTWLNHLHNSEDQHRAKFWPKWMLKEIENPNHTATTKAPRDVLSIAVNQLKDTANALRGTLDLKVFSHGDFHGNNLLMGNTTTYGIDFTESKAKLAVYDIVDILMMDLSITAEPHEIGDMGLIQDHVDTFLKGYTCPVSHDVLKFCVKARLLIKWLRISNALYEKSEYQRTQFHELQKRITTAFP